MQKELTIVSFHETYTGDNGSHTINTFKERHEAKSFILGNLEDTDEYHKEMLKGEVSKKLQESLMLGKTGRYSYTDGDHEYSIIWDFVRGEYKVTDDELTGVLDSYVNSNRSDMEYRRFAESITINMHRYCQNELFKLICHMIRAMASCNYDGRNVRMHNRAEMLTKFMNEQGL